MEPIPGDPEFTNFWKINGKNNDPYESDSASSATDNDEKYNSDEEINKKYSFIKQKKKHVKHVLKKEEYLSD